MSAAPVLGVNGARAIRPPAGVFRLRSVDNVMGRRAEGYSVRTHQHHFFWYADTEEVELYDVVNDPRGELNLSEDLPELVLDFKKAVAEWRDSIGMTERVDIYE